jgi:Uma2 family endonuclease
MMGGKEAFMSSVVDPPAITPAPPPGRTAGEGPFFIIPPSAHTLAGFRAWYASDDFPEEGRIEFLDGEIIVDMGHERLSSHVALKGDLTRALIGLAEELAAGEFYTDGSRLVNEAANLSCEPDGCYLTWQSVTAGRVQLRRSADGADVTEIVGTPEMVLELVSPSSVRKDTTRLVEAYHRAGIPEYWLVDARRDELVFRIFHQTPAGYIESGPTDGWRQSLVFRRQVRLDRTLNPIGIWKYRLLVRPVE